MIARFLLTICGLVLLFAVLAGIKTLQIVALVQAGQAATPPTAVTATKVESARWEETLSAVGTLEAAQGVTITADYTGRVTRLLFDGGETVQAGTLLLEQETSSETAQLDAAASELQLAEQNLDRVSRLFRSGVVSRAEYDTARSQKSAAQARFNDITATLDKKQILAPFGGRLGLRLVDIGQDLSPGVPIVSLQSVDSMRVNFSLPQAALARVTNGLPVRVTNDVVPGTVFTGSITAINTEVSTATRTVRIQATLDSGVENAEKLLPGMYASVEVVLPDTRDVLMIPQTAVNFATFGDSVFVLERADAEGAAGDESSDEAADGRGDEPGADKVSGGTGNTADASADEMAPSKGNDGLLARQQFVQLGERRGDFVEVNAGVSAGQIIANDGVFKLQNGAPVTIVETGSKATMNPTPDNG
ncbi:MAG: efflux transporter periplasmic adaptor subunit [Gammaproteobacteria bacterium]|nr:MAG: efflux transporter periplasmic adaptor subunit [Gammaproteobacteria bacterium]PIE35456.1 MAG: efflux transporter periplasmic adaptor subunit [Gammaproteobacteria bacterium]